MVLAHSTRWGLEVGKDRSGCCVLSCEQYWGGVLQRLPDLGTLANLIGRLRG